jgi:hypothetical protein
MAGAIRSSSVSALLDRPLPEDPTLDTHYTTAFTVGHSITLIGIAYDRTPIAAWFRRSSKQRSRPRSFILIFLYGRRKHIGAHVNQRWIISGCSV